MRRLILSLFICLSSFYAHAYTPALQAALFNASFKQLNLIAQNKLIGDTKSLYKTLNGEESASLIGHQYLKVASYMYLVEMWQSYSLQKVMEERGIRFSDEQVVAMGITLTTWKTPMNAVGPANYAVGLDRHSQCKTSQNQSFNTNYLTLIRAVNRLLIELKSVKHPQASRAALIYIKAYLYLRIHAPNSLYTYVNGDCISDVNGLLTCADDWLEYKGVTEPYIARIQSYTEVDLANFTLSEDAERKIRSCKMTMWHYLISSGAIEPLSDSQAIAASEALFSKVNGKHIKMSKDLSIQAIARDSRDLMHFIYFNKQYMQDNPEKAKKTVQTLLLNQMKVAALRTAELLKITIE